VPTIVVQGYQPEDLHTKQDAVVHLDSDKLGQSVSGLCAPGINDASDTGIVSSMVSNTRVSPT
jgi:hypothetical protein